MITVADIHTAISGMPDDATVQLHLVSAPEGLEVEFYHIEKISGQVRITGEAFLPDDADAV